MKIESKTSNLDKTIKGENIKKGKNTYTNKQQSLSESSKKSFWKDKKNIIIIVLSFLLLCFVIAYSDSNSYKYSSLIEDLNSQINTLKTENGKLNTKLEDNQNQIKSLQDENNLLKQQKEQLENEKQELTTKVTEMENTLSTQSSSIPQTSSTQSSTVNSNNSNASNGSNSSSASNISTTSTPQSNTNSQMVWVGATGSKYHNQGCGTLKGKGHQITLQQALAEGREPCKVCH